MSMRRVIRKAVRAAVAGVCLLSLLACAGAGWLWWRSGLAGPDRVSVLMADARYRVRSDGGRVVLTGPPASPAGGMSAAGARLRNDQLRWSAFVDHDLRLAGADWPAPADGTPAAALATAAGGDPVRPLLLALENPDQFVAAHFLLHDRYLPWDSDINRNDADADGSLDRWYDGLVVELTVRDPRQAEARRPDAPNQARVECVGRADPARLPAIRDQWHRRLDVPVASVGYRWIVAATALPPLLWLGVHGRRTWVRRRRRRLGLCRRCGYDLRGSPAGVCPECGAPVGTGGDSGNAAIR